MGKHLSVTLGIAIPLALVFAGLLGFRFWNMHRFHLERETRMMMDTYVTIYAVGPEERTSRAIARAFERMREVEEKFDMLRPRSSLHAFNHQGTPISDPEILGLLRVALDVSQKSGGAFDVSISPLVELWGFYGDSPRVPSDRDIRDCLGRIGYERLDMRGGRLGKRDPGIRIDLGGIAKGHALGQAAEVLKANGASSALIDAGGDVYALGTKGRSPWKVGLRNTREDGLMGHVEVSDMAVVGSGDYERFFMKDGIRYHHIFDPRTGYPARELSGIHVFHSDPAVADAWCTALFVMGPRKGLEIVENIPGMETVMVTASGAVICSSGLKKQLGNISQNR